MAHRWMAVYSTNVMQCQEQDHSASLDSYIQPIRFRMYTYSTHTGMPQSPTRPPTTPTPQEKNRTGQDSQTLGSSPPRTAAPATMNHAQQGIKHENKKNKPPTPIPERNKRVQEKGKRKRVEKPSPPNKKRQERNKIYKKRKGLSTLD